MPANRIGTLKDPLEGRVVVDANLNEVQAGDAGGEAFVYKKADLERAKARRKELKLGTDEQADEASRVQRESRAIEAQKAELAAARHIDEAKQLRANADADKPAKK